MKAHRLLILVAGLLIPAVGFIVTNLNRPAQQVVTFCNQRGKAEPYIK